MILFAALLPIAILVFYIYRKDKNVPEPTGQLLKAFFYGILSVLLSLCMSIPFGLLGLYPAESITALDSIRHAFFAAAVPEEIAKFVMLWLVVRKNRHFDERVDGIVYAVCVSLGFAALENVLYLFSNAESFVSVGVGRALFAVPGHFCFAVLMGYYYSLARFSAADQKKNYALTLIAPIMAHGIYDAILMVTEVAPVLSVVLPFVFLFFCIKMWKYASAKIQEHLKVDEVLR